MIQFIDPLALAIVGGGTLVATVARAPLADSGRALVALRTLGRRRFDAEPLLAQIESLGRIARRHGAVALDRTKVADPDIAAAVVLIVDGAQPAAIAGQVQRARRTRVERHAAAADLWAAAAETAPAMGMVGTLVGLARMFAGMTDPAAIGGAMAVALLATLYGALLANLVLAPIAARLRGAGRREAIERARIEAPLVALAERERPRLVATGPTLASVA